MERNILLQNDRITVRENPYKRGIEVLFPMKPGERTREVLKKAGFRWSRPQQLWWAYDNERARQYVEEEISYQHGMKKFSDWEEFHSEVGESSKNEEIEQRAFFSPENYLETFREKSEKLFDISSFNDYIVDNTINKNRQSEEKEAAYESNETDFSPSGQSEGLDGNGRREGSEGNSHELTERIDSQMDGNPRGGHAGTGYRDNISLTDGGRTRIEPSPVNSAASDGQVSEDTEQNVGDKNSSVRAENLQAGRMVNGISEHHGSPEQLGHGDVLTISKMAEPYRGQSAEGAVENSSQTNLTKSQARNIRSEIKHFLETHTDDEIKNNPEAMDLLSQYEGGGGLKEQDVTSAETLNAFYTPRNIVQAVWKIADRYAPDAVTVLEPSSGIGRFAENRFKNKFTLRELDPISARIAKILHPDAEVIQGAFQAQFYDENGIVRNNDYVLPKYDLVIGNPPYGAYSGEWKGKGEGKEFDRIEEYFIDRGLNSLKDEKSLLAFVMPSGFLNSMDDGQKRLIAEKGRLVGAFRLPEGAFPTTRIGTDILVMKKHGNRSRNHISEAMGEDELETRRLLSNGTYFKEHPENILGETKTRINRFGKEEEYVAVHEGLAVQDELDKIEKIIGDEVENAQVKQTETASPAIAKVHEFKTEKYPYINKDGTLNPDRIRFGDVIIRKEDNIPYSVQFFSGDNYIKVNAITMKGESTELFNELEEKEWSKEESRAFGTDWRNVLNQYFYAPTEEQLENWEYPAWYKKHLDYQKNFEDLRNEIRKPLFFLDYERISKDEVLKAFARTCAKEMDFLCEWNDKAREVRTDPATGESQTYGTDEYGYARVQHEFAGMCDFYGSDLVLSVIRNSTNHMAQNSPIDKDYYKRCINEYQEDLFEKAEKVKFAESIKSIVCSEEKVGKKECGNTIWDLCLQYKNLSKDRAINPEWTYAKVLEKENITPNDTAEIQNPSEIEETEAQAEKLDYADGQVYSYIHDGYAAKICYAVKEGNQEAVKTMASFLAKNVNEPCVLVPVPQHTGNAEYTLELAEEVRRIVRAEKHIEVEIADVLSSTPHETLYDQKKKLEKQEFTEEEISNLDCGDLKVNLDFKTENGKKYLALDNVYSTGKTFEETEKLVPGIKPLVFAVGHEGKEKFLNRFGIGSQNIPEVAVRNAAPVKKISNIEKALQAAKDKSLEVSQNEDVRRLLGIGRDIKISDFERFSRQQWSNSRRAAWYFKAHFDINTKQVLITTKIESNGKATRVLLGSILPGGQITKCYDEYSSEYQELRKKGGVITSAHQERLDSVFNDFSEAFLPVMDSFLGMKDGRAYFASINSSVPGRIAEHRHSYENDATVFSSERLEEIKIKNPINVVLSKNYYPKTYETERGKDDYDNIAVFAKLQTVFPEKGNVNLSAIDDDDAVARLAGDDVEIPPEKSFRDFGGGWNGGNSDENWEKYREHNDSIENAKEARWNAALDESARLSGFNSQEEYFTAASEIVRERIQKREKELEAKLKELRDNQDMDVVLNEILKHGFEIGHGEFSVAGYRINFSQNSNDHSAVDILMDGKKVLTVSEKETSLVSHGNFRVTPSFITKMKDRWGAWPIVSDEDIEEEILSLNEMLSERHFSKNDMNKGVLIAETFIGQSKNQGETYEFEQGDEHYIICKSGTVQKAYQGKSNYPLFEFDFKSNILKLCQESFEKGIITAVEETFRGKYANLTTIKDIVIGKNRYIDTNGSTIVAPAASQRYTPAKEKLLSNAEFAEVYGKKWDPKERSFWAATDWKGYVDTSKLTREELQSLEQSENYVLDFYEGNSRYIHKELYTSGNIYEKMDRLEELHKEGHIDEKNYRHNKGILAQSYPKPKRLDEIEVFLISPFVADLQFDGKPLKECFIEWATGCNLEDSENTRDNISDYADAAINRDDIPATISWGDIVDYADGIPLPSIRNDDLSEGEKAQVRNQKINDRKETAEKLFNRFIHTALSPEEEALIVNSYNRRFNSNRAPDYSKLPLFIDGMNMYRKGEKFRLYEQQIKGISFLCNKGNGILAYDVGVGKTAAGIVATVQQIQSGRALRPLIIVPKSVIGKWESDIHELFPDIPVNNLGNFSEKSTGAFYDKKTHGLNIPAGSITLVTKDALNNLHWDKDTVDINLFDDYADLLSLNDKLSSDNPVERANAKEKIYELACGKAGTVRDSYYVEWNATNFDHVTVDEAHAFKNLFKVPRPKKGASRSANEFLQIGSGEPSKRALKMFNITQLIQHENEDRNVFMLTATPFMNSPLEVYSMLVYVARKELEEKGIKDLYGFCAQYAKTRFERIVTAKDVKYGTVMKEFGDLQGLQNILKQYIDKVDGEEAGIIRPDKATHEVYLAPADVQQQIFEFATEILMEYKPDRNADEKRAPVLEAMNMMRTACLSPALVKQSKLIDPNTKTPVAIQVPPIEEVVASSPKLKLVCDTVIKNWQKYPDCGQVIYMPEGTDAYPYVIRYMKNAGIPPNVFASIDGSEAKIGGVKVGKSKRGRDDDDEDIGDDVRAKVAEAFNDKKNPCKILIGSAAISEGMDLNGNSVALYNTMLGWNLTESVQVEGRIWRQGNEQGKVHVVYPLIYDSIDSLLFQKHDEKQSRINDLFSFKGNSLNVADINPEELKYALIKNPVRRAKIEVEDIAVEKKKEILLLENQLQDFDQLCESRIKWKERLSEKKNSKQSYIANHKDSLFKGKPNRSEEEQKEGEARFDKSIEDCKKQLENIRRKFAEMGIKTRDDEANFADKVNEKKRIKKNELSDIYDHDNVQRIIGKYKKLLEEEKVEQLEKILSHPLEQDIQNDLVPMHLVERRTKEARYQEAMKKADGNPELQKELTDGWSEYLSAYDKKWNQKTVGAAETKSAVKTNGEQMADAVQSYSIVRIIKERIEEIDAERNDEAISQGFLFDIKAEPLDVTLILDNSEIDWKNTTADTFSDNLEAIFKKPGQKITREAVLKSAYKLLNLMSPSEKEKFLETTRQMDISTKEKSDSFFMDMARGKLSLNKNKTLVAAEAMEEPEYDIF